MAFFLVSMVQEFKSIENRDDCEEYVEEYVMTKQSRNGIKVAFTVNWNFLCASADASMQALVRNPETHRCISQ